MMKPRIKSLAVLALAMLSVCVAFLLVAGQRVNPVSRHSREAVLRTDLRTVRDAIDNYTLDKHQPPHSLQDLVDAGYLRAIPTDPITNKRDWILDFEGPVLADPVLSPDLKAQGLVDMHSNSSQVAADGSQYRTW